MKFNITLALLFSALFINNVYADNVNEKTCDQALEQGDVVGALTAANKALSFNSRDKDTLICQGRAFSAQGELNKALAAFSTSAKLTKDTFDQTIIMLVTGQAYKAAKQNDAAIASFEKSINFAKVANNQAFVRINQNAIGDIYFENKQFDQALAQYLAGSKLANNDNERGESFERVALTYHTLQQHDKALEYQLKAYLMHEQVGTLDQLAHSSIELGHYYTMVKSYVSAERTLNKIVKLAKEQGGAYYEAQGSYMLAKVKVAIGDIPAAKALVEHAKSIAKTTNDKALAEEIELETHDLY